MSKRKIYYRYNPLHDSYERVYPSRRARILNLSKNIFEGIVVIAVVFSLLYYWIDLPREKMLIMENRELKSELKDTERRLNDALRVMDDIAARDNSFYRVMLQADPVDLRQRVYGHDRVASGKTGDSELIRNIDTKIDLLERLIVFQSRSFNDLADMAADSKQRLDHIPSVQPVSEKDMTQMASGFSVRVDPIYGTMKFHEGMDFAAPTGTPVYATGNGVVSSAGWKSSYGNLIELDHGYDYTTRYAHLSEVLVHPGQAVRRGDLIGKVGNTGKSTGPHLHYEVRYKGEARNPVNYYYRDLTPEEYAELVRRAEVAANVMD